MVAILSRGDELISWMCWYSMSDSQWLLSKSYLDAHNRPGWAHHWLHRTLSLCRYVDEIFVTGFVGSFQNNNNPQCSQWRKCQHWRHFRFGGCRVSTPTFHCVCHLYKYFDASGDSTYQHSWDSDFALQFYCKGNVIKKPILRLICKADCM